MSETMISHEKHGDCEVVTILDDSGHDADLEIHFTPGGDNVVLRQCLTDEAEVTVLTPMQAHCLMEVLNVIVGGEVLH